MAIRGPLCAGGIQGVDGCYVEDGKSGTDRPREPQTMNSDLEHEVSNFMTRASGFVKSSMT